MIVNLTKQNFMQEVEESAKPVIVKVYALWCGPCQHMMPDYEELEKELGSKYKFTKLNVDEAREIAISYSVTSVPTLLFIKSGSVVGKEVGYMSKDDLKDKIVELLG